MNEQLSQIEKHLANIDVTLAKQEAHLSEHMRRSESNEKAIELIRKQLWAFVLAVVSVLVTILVHK